MAQIELEVTYFKKGRYDSKKWVMVNPSKSVDLYSSTVAKMIREGKETIVCLRSIEEDGTATLLNVTRTNIYDPKRSIESKVPAGSKK